MPRTTTTGVTDPTPRTPFGPRTRSRGPGRRAVLVALVALMWTSASAQVFSADRYLQECLRFEAGGDLTTARQSCLNALQVDPRLVTAELALARIDAAAGDYGAAESRLVRIRALVGTPEPWVLLAEVAFATDRFDEAAGHAARARSELAAAPDGALTGRVAFLQGALAVRDGRVDDALARYGEAIAFDPLALRYRLADAELRFRLGDVAGATAQLTAYEALSGDVRNADVKSLQGRLLWASGAVAPATDRLETALALRGLRDSAAQAEDLRVLALLYYAQGDFDAGGIALREALRRGNLVGQATSNAMLWLLALVVLLALSLVAESRRAGTSTDASEQPAWSLSDAYGVILTSALVGLAVSLLYAALVQTNLLALFTPLQRQDALAAYMIAFALTSAFLTSWRLRKAGFDPSDTLLGPPGTWPAGVLAGFGVAAVVLAYLAFVPQGGVFGPFLFDLARPTPLVAAALVVMPLAETAFRGLLQPSLVRRYGVEWAIALMALVWAIVVGAPVAALLLVGAGLALLTRRAGGPLPASVAVLTGWLTLLLLANFVPAVRGLFLA